MILTVTILLLGPPYYTKNSNSTIPSREVGGDSPFSHVERFFGRSLGSDFIVLAPDPDPTTPAFLPEAIQIKGRDAIGLVYAVIPTIGPTVLPRRFMLLKQEAICREP